ncbi:MAG: FadR family transcriptional regulator [Calditerrivibrio sp.]|nr:FadR family transcriptional regulator [Calditerrivibrio sp.]
MFQKIKPKKISDEVYNQIKSVILSGKLKPGEKLPPERDLALELGVSRTSLREAIQKLEAQGFLYQVQGGGTFVKTITNGILDTAIEEFVKRDEAIFDLMEIRKILETWGAHTAASRATEEELENMRKYLEEMREAKEKGQIGHISDANFHLAISHATHNVMLIHLMKNLFYWIEKVSYEVRSRMYTNPESHADLFRQHTDIYNAIAQRDSEKAYHCMLVHMNYIVTELNRIFKKNR